MAIVDHSRQCVRSFGRLAEFIQENVGDYESQVSITTVSDEFGRFKIWAGNIGALQEDSRSLDYRLREASQVRDQVTKILQDLEFSLRECIAIVSGQRAQQQSNSSDEEEFGDEFSDASDSESSNTSGQEPTSELAQLFLAITEAITSLYKLSITIRNPAPRDRYAKAASLIPYDVSYDVGHVYEKYPHVRSTPWLMDKVGRAITRRREFLCYREKHREKLATNVRPFDMSERNEQAESRRMASFIGPQTLTECPIVGVEAQSISHSQLASTKATTYVANLNDENLDIQSIASRSETSYVTSIAEENSDSMRQIPDPPKESANGMPFECPYCFTILTVKNTKQWKKHFLSDLRPYICTFEGCSTQMFQSRHEWFQHELDKHRKEWHCCLCSNEIPFSSAANLKAHLHQKHSEYSGQQASALLSLCEKPLENIAVSACPFCAWDSSRSIDPQDFFSMASVSLSRDLWDPYRVLDVYPNVPNFTCIGFAISSGLRCKWRYNSEQLDTSQRATAVKCLESISQMHPSEVTPAVLSLLAENTLCRDFHQWQTGAKITEWKAKIEDYLHKHSERLATVSAVSLLEKQSLQRSDLLADGPNLHPQSGDRDVDHGPVSRKHSTSSPTVMVSSLQFQRHVAHHLEQLALFALPPPMKESSGASSNQAAASHNSDHTTGADVISEISSQSSAPTDYGNTPELYAAVTGGDIEGVRQEIRNGADLTLQWGRFRNVLQAAAVNLSWPSRDEILRTLLNHGAHANMQGGLYGNALQAVAANPGVSGCRLLALGMLLDHGADVNAAGGRYGHALIAAAAMPTPPSPTQQETTSMVLKILLDHGANPDAQELKHGSALHQAIEHNDDESVQLLLDRGASVTVNHENYETPVHLAMKIAYGPVWHLLREAAVETNLGGHYDRVRLSSALKIQRNFRRRQNSGDKAWSSPDEEIQKPDTTGPGPPTDAGYKPDPNPVDILSIIISLQNLVETVTESISVFGEVAWEPQSVFSVLCDVNALLMALQSAATGEKDSWYPTLQELNVPNGPIEELRGVSELLKSRLKRYPGLKNLGKPTPWRFQTEEVERILGILLHQEELLNLAQQNDSTLLSQAIKGDGGPHVPPGRPVPEVSNFTIPPPVDGTMVRQVTGIAVALFNFKPENEKELPLREGQVIWLLETEVALFAYEEVEGWIIAQDPKTGKAGFVPKDYLRTICFGSSLASAQTRKGILKSSQPQPSRSTIDEGEDPAQSHVIGQPAPQAKGKATEGRLRRLWSTVNPSARRRRQGLQPQKGTGLSSEDQGVALFSFDGDQVGELSFKKGEIVTITQRTESVLDWWTGKIGFREGTFPGNYVEVLPPGWKETDLVQGQSTPESTVPKSVRFDNKVGVATFSQIEQPSTLYYGVSLEELCQREKRPVPKLITDCIEAIERYGIGLKGVYSEFHIDWNENLTDDLKAEYDRDPESLFLQRLRISNNIEYVAQLLKVFIWQLPGLLIPRETLARFVRAAQIVARQRIGHFGYEKGEGQATTVLQAAIRELPQVNRNVFEFLVLHFRRVADKAYQNTMTNDKLATALAPSFKGGVDSGAGPKIPLADLTWAIEYIIRRGEFWFRNLDKPPDIVTDDVKATQPTCTVCREDFTPKEATTEEGLRALPCGHIFHHDCIGAYLSKYHKCPVCKAVIGPNGDGLKDGNDEEKSRWAYDP